MQGNLTGPLRALAVVPVAIGAIQFKKRGFAATKYFWLGPFTHTKPLREFPVAWTHIPSAAHSGSIRF
jgi:hypothetical protein